MEKGGLPAVSVPFIEGDLDGGLTAAIISAISSSGVAKVQAYGGEYVLQISILSEETDKIGFRIDPQKVDGKVRKNLLASEARRTMTLDVSFCSKEGRVKGPYRITADVDYDYVDGDSIQDLTFTAPGRGLVTVLPFSLGQLEPNESAALASTRPLYRKLAQKLVDALSSEL